MLRKVSYVICVVSVMATVAVAQPVINSGPRSFSTGQAVTLSGTSFGQKIPAEPLKFDDFSGGIPGNRVAGWTLWSNSPDGHPKYSDSHVRVPGTLATLQSYGPDVGNSTLGITELDYRELYVRGWFYNEAAGGPSRNVKIISLRGGPGDTWNFPNGRFGCGYVGPTPTQTSNTGYTTFYTMSCDGTHKVGGGHGLNLFVAPYTQSWHNVEVYCDLNDPGQANGTYTLDMDFRRRETVQGEFNNNGDCNFTKVFLMSYFAAAESPDPAAYMDWWWDEIYIDYTRARIEIGDAANWNDCTHREIQIPTAWTNDAVTFRARQGTFAPDQPLYVFLVDDSGAVSAQGYQVAFSASQDNDVSPIVEITAPTGFSVFETTATTVDIAGTATDDIAIASVSYRTSDGRSGSCANTSGDWRSWAITGLALDSAETTITIEARDNANQLGMDALTVRLGGAEPNIPGQPGTPVRVP